ALRARATSRPPPPRRGNFVHQQRIGGDSPAQPPHRRAVSRPIDDERFSARGGGENRPADGGLERLNVGREHPTYLPRSFNSPSSKISPFQISTRSTVFRATPASLRKITATFPGGMLPMLEGCMNEPMLIFVSPARSPMRYSFPPWRTKTENATSIGGFSMCTCIS